MKEQLNSIINNYYRRLYERNGYDRYFDREYITENILSDKELVKEIKAFAASVVKGKADGE